MTRRVTVIDYGIGNIFSVTQAFEKCGGEVQLSRSPEQIADAERLVLPGVGAFGDGMEELQKRGLIEPLRQYAQTGRPFLGICLGMQMMLETSEEFGHHKGLGLVAGSVKSIPRTGTEGRPHRVPHIGWNELVPGSTSRWDGTILDSIPMNSSVYFVHSFAANPATASRRLADCDYDGHRLSAVITDGSLYGCQFHPEKSGPIGLQILSNFLNLRNTATATSSEAVNKSMGEKCEL